MTVRHEKHRDGFEESLVETAGGNLPLLIDTILPNTGTYTVHVNNITRTNSYTGLYHISIKSSGNAYTRFRAGSSVEISQNASSDEVR